MLRKEGYMKRIIIVMFCILTFVAACQKGDTYTITEPYQYPVVPGMTEWYDLKSLQEKSDACQIPYDILPNMTTEALVETVVDYPLFVNAFAYDIPQMGLSHIKEYYNGLQELYTRDDAIKKIEVFIKEEIPKLMMGNIRECGRNLFWETFSYSSDCKGAVAIVIKNNCSSSFFLWKMVFV